MNENGRQQAENLRMLKKLPLENNNVQLYSSPLKRALETCQIATMAAPDEIRMDEVGFRISVKSTSGPILTAQT